MCTENATQRGAEAAAILNEIAAATRRIAGVVLRAEHLSEFSEKSIKEIFDSERSFDSTKGRIANGGGLGQPTLSCYLKNNRSTQQIREGIDSLKASGIIQGFADGRIELPSVKISNKGGGAIRYAPTFRLKARSSARAEEHPYTAATLAEFLGWKATKVEAVLNALRTSPAGAISGRPEIA